MRLPTLIQTPLIVCLCVAGRCAADYALPNVEERLVLLLPPSQVELNSQKLTV